MDFWDLEQLAEFMVSQSYLSPTLQAFHIEKFESGVCALKGDIAGWQLCHWFQPQNARFVKFLMEVKTIRDAVPLSF